jgi:tellurite resistance protein TerB
MKLADLDADETLALVALIKAIVLTDQSVSADEAEALPPLIEQIGEDRYQRSYVVAKERLADDVSLKAFLGEIHRPEARRLIYDTILRLARADGVDPDEARLLDWVYANWKI